MYEILVKPHQGMEDIRITGDSGKQSLEINLNNFFTFTNEKIVSCFSVLNLFFSKSLGASEEEFINYTNILLDIVTDQNSTLLMSESGVKKLEDCISRVSDDTPADYCPVIFDSVSCFNATPAGLTQRTPCPRNNVSTEILFSPIIHTANKTPKTYSLQTRPKNI